MAIAAPRRRAGQWAAWRDRSHWTRPPSLPRPRTAALAHLRLRAGARRRKLVAWIDNGFPGSFRLLVPGLSSGCFLPSGTARRGWLGSRTGIRAQRLSPLPLPAPLRGGASGTLRGPRPLPLAPEALAGGDGFCAWWGAALPLGPTSWRGSSASLLSESRDAAKGRQEEERCWKVGQERQGPREQVGGQGQKEEVVQRQSSGQAQ